MTNRQKWIEHNSKLYGDKIKSLKEIANRQIEKSGSSDQFTSDMLLALISGRRITDKMVACIDGIIERDNPKYKAERYKWLESVVPKINLVIDAVEKTSWTSGYKRNTTSFLKDISKQAKGRMSLSTKQMEAVNKVYKKIIKNIEKSS
ncbi:hypothetical protein CMI47_14240 [Candidatus Pacearchaeota archaeon]|nr:hypothetical protein [Candidatus Pacearchaeota archaeon]